MADAYKLKADVSFPEPLGLTGEGDEQEVLGVIGRNYAAGDYVLASALTPRDRERADSGELDHLLEPADLEEAQQALSVVERGLFIPEHEAESVVLMEAGHEIVPRDQVLELKAAGAEAAMNAQEEAKADGADERPGVTLAEFPSLAEVSNDTEGGVNNVPQESEPVSEERLRSAPSSSVRGVEQPPGLQVGEVKAAQEGEQVEESEASSSETEAPAPRRRGRPRKVRQEEQVQQQEAVEAQREQTQREVREQQ